MKKVISLFILGIISFTIIGCTDTKENKTDDVKFKEEYEKLNNIENEYNNKKYRALNIKDDNIFIYKSVGDIIDMMNNKDTFVVYFGFASCPWCRSIINPLIKVADDLGIDAIYYVDVKEIRDTIIIDEEGNIITPKEGTKDYYKLIEKLDLILEDYIITDKNGIEVKTGKKRIYAPNIVAVVEGDAIKLTDKMEEESYNKIKNSIECTIKKRNMHY